MNVPVDRLLSQAKRHAKKGELSQSAELYRAVLARFPGNKHAQQGLASLGIQAPAPAAHMGPFEREVHALNALYDQRRLAEVVKKATALLDKFSKEVVLLNILGAAHAGLGHHDEAVESFRQAVAIDPNVAEAHFNYGLALKSKGDQAAAIQSYRRAIEIRPAYPEAFYNLGISLKAIGDLSGAIDCYQQAIQINPGYVKALRNLGNLLKSTGDFAGALECYNQEFRIQPNVANLNIALGDTLSALHRYDDAIDAYKRALQIDPQNQDAKGQLGVTLMLIGKLEEGLTLQDEGFGVISFGLQSGVALETGNQK